MAIYWTEETHGQAIAEYLSLGNGSESDRIFSSVIYPGLMRLAKGRINQILGSKISKTENDDLVADLVVHLTLCLGKFDPSRGVKSFSYLNQIAQNFCFKFSNSRSTLFKEIEPLNLTSRSGEQYVNPRLTTHSKSTEELLMPGSEMFRALFERIQLSVPKNEDQQLMKDCLSIIFTEGLPENIRPNLRNLHRLSSKMTGMSIHRSRKAIGKLLDVRVGQKHRPRGDREKAVQAASTDILETLSSGDKVCNVPPNDRHSLVDWRDALKSILAERKTSGNELTKTKLMLHYEPKPGKRTQRKMVYYSQENP